MSLLLVRKFDSLYVSLKLCFWYFFMLQIIFMTFINFRYFVENCNGNNSTQHSGFRRARGKRREVSRWNLNWNVGRIILSRAIASENEKMEKLCCYIKTQKSVFASFHIDVENFNCFAEEEVLIVLFRHLVLILVCNNLELQ